MTVEHSCSDLRLLTCRGICSHRSRGRLRHSSRETCKQGKGKYLLCFLILFQGYSILGRKLAWLPLADYPNCMADYTDTKGEGGNPGLYDGYRSSKVSMHRKTFSLRLGEISHHTGIFSGCFSIPTAGILPNGHYYP